MKVKGVFFDIFIVYYRDYFIIRENILKKVLYGIVYFDGFSNRISFYVGNIMRDNILFLLIFMFVVGLIDVDEEKIYFLLLRLLRKLIIIIIVLGVYLYFNVYIDFFIFY